MPSALVIPRRYCDAVWEMRRGDLLLYRRDATLLDLEVAKAGRGVHCHSAMLDVIDGEFRILEVIRRHGYRETSLLDAVLANPGHWDVFQANADGRWPEFDADLACARMHDFEGQKYGYWHILRIALARLPLVGLVLPYDDQQVEQDGGPPICSEATELSYTAGGVTPVPNLPPSRVEPADQARSLFFKYRFTLWP
jgi:hypothetical protein